MLDVFFEKEEEMKSFGDMLKKKSLSKNQSSGDLIQLEKEETDCVSKALAFVFQRHRLQQLLTDIIQDIYYYTDAEEVARIHDLAIGMFAGESLNLEVPIQEETLSSKALEFIFTDSIQGKEQVHFDSIIRFRMPQIRELAVYITGLAIDEYKREEDHQSFIHSLREHVSIKETSCPLIHVLQGESFRFYSEFGMSYNRTDLVTLLKREALIFTGLPTNEWNLSPLVALNPSVIYLYGNDPSEHKIQTVLNVFEERVQFRQTSEFPFSYMQKNRNDA